MGLKKKANVSHLAGDRDALDNFLDRVGDTGLDNTLGMVPDDGPTKKKASH